MMKYFLPLVLLFSCATTGKYKINSTYPLSIIYVDEKTEKQLGEFPLKRQYYGELVQKLQESKPKYIILKFFFDQEKPGDEEFIAKIKDYKNILTQASSFWDHEENKVDIRRYSFARNEIRFPQKNNVMFPYPKMRKAFDGVGFVNATVTEKGEVNSFELVSDYKGRLYQSLPLFILHKETGGNLQLLGKRIKVGNLPVPINIDGSFKLRLSRPGKLYPTYSFIDVINGKIDPTFFKNHIVIVFYRGDKISPAKGVNGFEYNPAEVVADAINSALLYLDK